MAFGCNVFSTCSRYAVGARARHSICSLQANVLQRDRRSDSQRDGSRNESAVHHGNRRARRSGSSLDGNAAHLHRDHMDEEDAIAPAK